MPGVKDVDDGGDGGYCLAIAGLNGVAGEVVAEEVW